jgi:hypothetical protein
VRFRGLLQRQHVVHDGVKLAARRGLELSGSDAGLGVVVDEGCADPDPWRGFCSVVEGVSVLNGRGRGLLDAFMSAHPEAEAIAAHRASVLRKLRELSRRAKATGGLRRDFTIDDLVLVILAGRGVAALPAAQREGAARRFAALAVDAFRA